MHPIDLIRKTRDRQPLTAEEIQFLVAGAAAETIPADQLAAWLMAARLRGLSLDEIRRLTLAMRDSGERFQPHAAPAIPVAAVDKHSTGGVGDKTSFLVAPIAAACGLAVPMISGRALGHTGGTLDKLESIPGFRTALSLDELAAVLRATGLAIVSQTPALVPADRVLYALRDRTATVDSPGLICASILSKKLAAGLDALVLDVKTGSGAFLRDPAEAEFLAALLVSTANAAGTRTVALLTDMSQPLGTAVGNWIELAEAVALLRNEHAPAMEPLRKPLRELCLDLAAWMLHLGGVARSVSVGRAQAQRALYDGSALDRFLAMVVAQGGDPSVFDQPFHRPGVTHTLAAPRSGSIIAQDTTALGWAVQRLGARRTQPGAPVDPHAGIHFHFRNGDSITTGQPLATLYASGADRLPEAIQLFHAALTWADALPAARLAERAAEQPAQAADISSSLVHSVIDAQRAAEILSAAQENPSGPLHLVR